MKLIKILSAVIVALVLGSVTLTNRSVDDSLVVSDLARDISSLQNENTILAGQVAALGSLGNLTTKIAQAGFIESPKVVSLSTTSSVASR